MEYVGEHLLIGQLGNLLLLIAFVFGGLSAVAYFLGERHKDESWKKLGRYSFWLHSLGVIGMVVVLFSMIALVLGLLHHPLLTWLYAPSGAAVWSEEGERAFLFLVWGLPFQLATLTLWRVTMLDRDLGWQVLAIGGFAFLLNAIGDYVLRDYWGLSGITAVTGFTFLCTFLLLFRGKAIFQISLFVVSSTILLTVLLIRRLLKRHLLQPRPLRSGKDSAAAPPLQVLLRRYRRRLRLWRARWRSGRDLARTVDRQRKRRRRLRDDPLTT